MAWLLQKKKRRRVAVVLEVPEVISSTRVYRGLVEKI